MMNKFIFKLFFALSAFGLTSISCFASTPIKCEDAPLSGLPFKECGANGTWKSFKGGENQSYFMNYKDKQSELQVIFLSSINSGGGLGRVLPSDILSELRRQQPRMTREASNWGKLIEKNEDDYYVNFDREDGKKCMGFYRRGAKIYTDAWKWMIFAVFCRKSDVPIPVAEGQFLVDMIKIK
jgi:hypothetical protein